MLLTITTTCQLVTELGLLLHKHPQQHYQSFSFSFGQAHVFYPEVSTQRCTVALLLEVNAAKLVRGRGMTVKEYLSDRPYVASSFLSIAIAQVFETALADSYPDQPKLANHPVPLVAKLPVLPCRGGEKFLRQLFEPLGYCVSIQNHLLDENFPEWGQSHYYSLELQHTLPLSAFLSHLYVLIPVLDDDKHYWMSEEKIKTLLLHARNWLADHPAGKEITKSYLQRQSRPTPAALLRLTQQDNLDPDGEQRRYTQQEAALETPLNLQQQRLKAVVSVLKQRGARRVIDFGCGQGNLLKILLKDRFFEQITGVDVSYHCLEIAKQRLDRLRLPRHRWNCLQLIHSPLTYDNKRFQGYDAATVLEVIEHLELWQRKAFERVVFERAQPKLVILTTPNREYNIKFQNLPAGRLRHPAHRWEWTREEFRIWANAVAERFGYKVEFQPVGVEVEQVGSPTQMGIFMR